MNERQSAFLKEDLASTPPSASAPATPESKQNKSTPTIQINFDQIIETLRSGARRADVFMGVGLNASEQAPPISHQLGQEQALQIHLVKQELNNDEKIHVAIEFGKWVRANGIRELLETFSIFMNELYSSGFFIKLYRKQLNKDLSKCRPKKFERLGISDQIQQLSKIVSVSEQSVRIISSLNHVRNCYAHRRGVVSKIDLDDGKDTLGVFWNALQVQVREDNGKITSGADIFGRTFENGGTVEAVVTERSKTFSLGSELVLGKQDLKEICLCVLSIGQSLFKEVVALAHQAGIIQKPIEANLEDPKPV